jgi:hypothetical protein
MEMHKVPPPQTKQGAKVVIENKRLLNGNILNTALL